jgi:hypothetical protein
VMRLVKRALSVLPHGMRQRRPVREDRTGAARACAAGRENLPVVPPAARGRDQPKPPPPKPPPPKFVKPKLAPPRLSRSTEGRAAPMSKPAPDRLMRLSMR